MTVEQMVERFIWFASHPGEGQRWCLDGVAPLLATCEMEQAARKGGHRRATLSKNIGRGRGLSQGDQSAQGGESGDLVGRYLYVENRRHPGEAQKAWDGDV